MRHRKPITVAIQGPILRYDLPGLYERVCHVAASGEAPILVCDLLAVEADAVAVDALARLVLAARRYDCQVRLRGASRELRELVSFMGLEDVLSAWAPGSS